MFIREVTVVGGIAFLDPDSVTLLGGQTREREERREHEFRQGLRFRMK